MFRRLAFVLLLGLVVTLIGTVQVPSVNAGTNGQQLGITYYAGAGRPTRITVQGTNQYGAQATWFKDVPPSSKPATVITSGWYWKGTVLITYGVAAYVYRTCSPTVPSFWAFNVYYVQC